MNKLKFTKLKIENDEKFKKNFKLIDDVNPNKLKQSLWKYMNSEKVDKLVYNDEYAQIRIDSEQ